MRLSDLLRGLVPCTQQGSVDPKDSDPEILGVCHDSRRVRAGDLYVSISGKAFDGREFVAQAVERGAVAVLAEGLPLGPVDIPWVEVDAVRPLMAPLAARVYDHPDRKVCLIGITGTNGKSTVVTLMSSILEAAGVPTGVIGTLGYRFAGKSFDGGADNAALRTTPEAPDFYRTLDAMHRQGAVAVVMEVSSHALELGRVGGAQFQLAAFTNLTHDHLDFHGDFESYFAAKRRLFDQLAPAGRAVICTDGAYGRQLADELPSVVTFGSSNDRANEDIRVTEEHLDYQGMDLEVSTPRGPLKVTSKLLGSFNRDNVLAAIALVEALAMRGEDDCAGDGLDVSHAAIVEGLKRQGPLPGRLEPVAAGQSFPALVDYAHTPDALRAVLDSLRGLGDQKLAVVFGCGGDRDPSKRLPMGRIVGERADLPVLTSDNPRGEDPTAILSSVEEGVRASGHQDYRMHLDRRQAIDVAVAQASSAPQPWAVLVAGKGHETVQILADHSEPFDDRKELAAAIRRHLPSSTSSSAAGARLSEGAP